MLIKIIRKILLLVVKFNRTVSLKILRKINQEELRPRHWSNRILRDICKEFYGDIINVSGWDDRDKEADSYRNYFPNKRSYTISNFIGTRGIIDQANEILLDLTKKIDEELVSKFDVVFNHTTLEHVFDIRTAFKNLCLMSRDIVILITPFKQQVHHDDDSYLDYWRPTHYAIREMFNENGFSLVYSKYNENLLDYSIYLVSIGTRFPEKWEHLSKNIK